MAGVAVTTKAEAHQAWASQLRDSVDGRELTAGRVNKVNHLWLHKPA